jgi:SAM-dependent methyltransferase
VAAEAAAAAPPDWLAHRALRHNVVQYTKPIDRLLESIAPATQVLEIGCNAGWLAVAMARRGAIVHGVDIADRAIAMARAYYESNRHVLPGVATYEVADLNDLALDAAAYDLIVAKGILHHLTAVEPLIERLYTALRPGGRVWISDTDGIESGAVVALAGAMTLVLPTAMPYRDKLRGIVRFGWRAPDRVRASMEARGLSPFEGAGRNADWPAAVRRRFDIEIEERQPAVTGYVEAQLRAPDRVARPFLAALAAADRALVHAGVLRSTGLTIQGRKPPGRR